MTLAPAPPDTPAHEATRTAPRRQTIALVGNPNAGKTTLFNALTGLRAKTANFPGTTIELRVGALRLAGESVRLIDMPGLYSLSAASSEERAALDGLLGLAPEHPAPTALILLLDSTNLERNLFLASQVLELGLPTVIALNMVDLAQRLGLRIKVAELSRELGCPVVPVVAKTGRGVDELRAELERVIARRPDVPHQPAAERARQLDTQSQHQRYDWAERVVGRCVVHPDRQIHGRSEAIDRVLTHPVVGVVAFLALMLGVFYLIFSLASIPMDLIDGVFGWLGDVAAGLIPAGPLQSLIVDGMIAGVGGVVIFLPQICILFFLIALLEDTGYLARAAFVMDRLMRRVGLPGKAFVPMLSAHACAVPAIMATKVIDDRRDRLVTILVLPLMTCSARLPVYAMVTGLLFPTQPLLGAAAFTGAYSLGILAAISMALIFKRTILPGQARPLVLELPSYKMPSLKTAFFVMLDRGIIFLKKAGTVILALSIVLWWLANFPEMQPGDVPAGTAAQVAALEAQAAALETAGQAEQAALAADQAADLISQQQLAHSFLGRLGHLIEPAVLPMGFDWQLGVGVLASFAAREVVVSTLSILYGLGEEGAEGAALVDQMRAATRPDGSLVFTLPVCFSLLVFYVLAMQCFATTAIAAREAGGWRWALLQLGYMTVLAYGAATLTYQGLTWLGAA
ncbi:MAG TPA: ferrous iron transporter B [Candidatus Sumerlaeota bacterium]|nr:ferrous iron transporter B [Candidatus Sumerlaeota bacterium]HPK01492.1 ferrous iron transporter B [Candidatus Sumerlaeota bacterium]